MAQYRWKPDLADNRRQAIHFLTRRVGISREFLEDVIEEVKQASAPVKHRQSGFRKKMPTETERLRASELAREIRDWEKRSSGAAGREASNRIARRGLDSRKKELARLTRRYNFARPASRSKLVSRLLYGFSHLNQTNAGGRELRCHAIHGFAILLYCDGLLKVSEKAIRHAAPAYSSVMGRIRRFTSGKFPRRRKRRILERIVYITNLRHGLLSREHR